MIQGKFLGNEPESYDGMQNYEHSTIYFDYKNYNLYYLVQFSNCFMMLILYLPYKNF